MLHVASETTREAKAVGWQHTVAGPVRVTGKGLLLGEDATIEIMPAPADHGIVFERVDLDPPVRIPADARYVTKRARRTTLTLDGATVETVEHCMSALAGLQIDNALIQINGPELPCGDGSAQPFVEPILAVGLEAQDVPRRVYRVKQPIMIEDGDAMISIFPSEQPEFSVTFDLDYGDNGHRIKRQLQSFTNHNGDYRSEIALARTFSLVEEARALWDRGMCRHLTPTDVLVIGEDGPIDNEYRYDNEPVRHKILDLIGDLYLVGRPVHGRVVARKSGHDLNRRLGLRLIEQIKAEQRAESVKHGIELDIRAIQRIMPHRYPMLLVDRVVSVDGDRKAIGVKNVTINEPFFNGHYPGTPIMPGVLIVEGMAQLGGLLMSRKLEHTGKIAVLLSLDKVKLRRPVTPGDQLVMEAEAIRTRARTGTMRCRSWVGDQIAAEAQIRFMMVDAEAD
ncbi:MAG: UDP-3-O-acyl-N-acetylglucosamine deacetylase [Phycisphaerales bacterium]